MAISGRRTASATALLLLATVLVELVWIVVVRWNRLNSRVVFLLLTNVGCVGGTGIGITATTFFRPRRI